MSGLVPTNRAGPALDGGHGGHVVVERAAQQVGGEPGLTVSKICSNLGVIRWRMRRPFLRLSRLARSVSNS